MSKFQTVDFYKSVNKDYKLLPFRFTELEDNSYILTNIAGEYHVVERETLEKLIRHQLSSGNKDYLDLRSKQFLTDQNTSVAHELLAIKLRTRYSVLPEFTGLHMFVVTLRCEHSCPYCQVSRQSDDKLAYDMSVETASNSVDLALRSPSRAIKIEFQGGEPLLNFDIVKYIVIEANKRKQDKEVSFVIATNLALLTDEVLEFCKENNVQISTSLDGPQELHNKNRPKPEGNSYQAAVSGIKRVKAILGKDNVSALMTTTFDSLSKPEEIIDEYLKQGLGGIFLRPLSPYGWAIKTKTYTKYNVDMWHEFYVKGLEYVIELNRQGIKFKEYYTSTILTKVFTHNSPGYVDLMSPAGIGIAAVIYNYDGTVYPSDEARMLAEMGDKYFDIGNVNKNTYEEIWLNPKLLDAIEDSFAYSVPMCNECAFEDYCGAEPVFHWGMQKDIVGRKPESEWCQRNMKIFKYIFKRMEGDPFVKKLFREWGQVDA